MSKISAADHLEIANLAARYCLTTDNADAESFMECWVSPEEFGGYDSGAFGSMPTWQEMFEFEKHHVGPGGMANGKRHQATNIHITVINENEVLLTHDLLVIEVAEVPQITATGRYNNSVVVRTEKGWKFKSRTLDVDPGFFKLPQQG